MLRGLAFVGDALAHAAVPGVVIAYLLKGNIYLGATIFALATALAIVLVSICLFFPILASRRL